MRNTLVSGCVCILMLMLAGCASSPGVTTVALHGIEDKGLVKLHRSLSAGGGGRPVNMDYGHPHDFTASEIDFELGLLSLKKFQWGKFGMGNKWVEKPIFPETSRERLIPALVSAFKEATRSDRIAFNIPGRDGRPTTGEVYLKDNQLIWMFEAIDGFPFTGKDKFWLDGEQWTIKEKTGLVVKEHKDKRVIEVVRDLSVKAEVTAEMAEERLSEPSEEISGEIKEEGVSLGLKGLEEKLQTLKKWKENGLISEEEYKKEKDRILEQLQQL